MECLGSGVTGRVHRAVQISTDTVVAMKLAPAEDSASIQELRREFRHVTRLLHPNLVRSRSIGMTDRFCFVTMDLVQGTSLLEAAVAGAREWSGVMQGVARAIDALHEVGILHGDLKPSNVMVDATGRARVLDFGFSIRSHRAAVPRFEGTAEYLAPEVLLGGSPSSASDWYAFGVLLHHVLVGRSPFPAGEPVVAKMEGPRLEASGMPYGELVSRLLAAEPSARPAAEEVLETLGVRRRLTAGSGRRRTLVGRTQELERLTSGRVVWLHGEAGVGKSALVEAFASAGDRDVWIGECFERQAVPFGGLGAVVEDILDRRCDVGERVPAELGLLFPWVVDPPTGPLDPAWRRAQGLEALERLFHSLPDDVIVLENAQWASRDTLDALLHLTRSCPALRVVVTSRGSIEEHLPELDAEVVELGPLSPSACAAMIGNLAPGHDATPIVQASGGLPMAVEMLCRRLRDPDAGESVDERAQHLLRLIALCHGPLPVAAVEMEPAELGPLLEELEIARWVVPTSSGLRCLHAAMAADVLSGLGPEEEQALHRELMAGLLAADAPRGTTAEHALAAGRTELALRLFTSAAAEARRRHAFHSAADLYGRAVVCSSGREGESLQQERIGMLSAAGRGAEAASMLLDAAASHPSQRHGLECRAVEQLLTKGHFDEGVVLLRKVLEREGIRWPASDGAAMGAMALDLLGLLLGLPVAGASRCAEVCWVGGRGLMALEPARGAALMVRGLRAARAAGDEQLTARFEGVLGAIIFHPVGGLFTRWARRLLRRARQRADGLQDDRLVGFVDVCQANRAVLDGEWSEALEMADRGVRRLAGVPDTTWARNVGHMAAFRALEEAGRFRDLRERVELQCETLEHLGDLHAWFTARLFAAQLDLLEGRSDEVRSVLPRLRDALPRGTFLLQEFYVERLVARLHLLDGDPGTAWTLVERCWPRLEASGLMRLSVLALDAWLMRARVAQAAGRPTADALRALRRVRSRGGADWADALVATREGDVSTLLAKAGVFSSEGQIVAARACRARAGEDVQGLPVQAVQMLLPRAASNAR